MARNKGGGYGRPPMETRFAKGRSGNPRGRPKGSKSFSTILTSALNEKITINQNGRSQRVSKFEVIARQLVNKSAGADWAAVRLLMGAYQLFSDEGGGAASLGAFEESDRKILQLLKARLARLKSGE